MMLSIRTVPKRSNTMNDTYTACPAYSDPGTIQNHRLGSPSNQGSLRAPSYGSSIRDRSAARTRRRSPSEGAHTCSHRSRH
jgi:hypothetical protein